MPRSLLPPRGIFTGTRWLFDPQLSPNIKDTLLQLMALTWGSDGHTTPPLSYALLEAVTHKDARTLRGHFLALRGYHAALRLQRAGAGQFIIVLAGWLFRNDNEQAGQLPSGAPLPGTPLSGKTLPAPVKDDQNQEEDSLFLLDENLPPLNADHDQAAANERANGQRKKGAKQPARPTPAQARRAQKQAGLNAEIEARLLAAGIFPILLAEIGARAAQGGYSAAELGALLEWCQKDQPERAAQLFVGRLRAGARAPAAYLTPACPRCHQHGQHDPECSRRFEMDNL